MAVGHAKEKTQTGLHMNALFFGMSVIVLVVMIVTMWKDIHPQWIGYQDRFAQLERQILLAKKRDLSRQLKSPDPVADYDVAKGRYDKAKETSDTAAGKLETTEADLEELELQLKGPDTEGDAAAPAPSSAKPSNQKASSSDLAELDKAAAGDSPSSTPAANSKPSAGDLAELDKESTQGNSKGAPSQKASDMAELDKEPTGSKGTTPGAKADSSDLAELDKEPTKSDASKAPTKAEASDLAELDKESTKGAKEPSSNDLAELDKEAAKQGGTAPTPSASSSAETKSAAAERTFDEADFQIDQLAADARLESATRDFLAAQRVHSREMIGLPKEAALERKHSDMKLTEAQLILEVAKAGDELERVKADVKAAALVARWSQTITTLTKMDAGSRTADQTKQLDDAQSKLAQHNSDLERDLRLVESRLTRNSRNEREIQQVYIQRLGAVDRCQSCHMGIDDPAFASLQQPFRTHPGKILATHPIEKYGCVSCHGGSGSALEKNEAHGELVGKGSEMRDGPLVQASCAKCHGDSKSLGGALTYLSGKQLFTTSGCVGCHKVDQLQESLKAGPSLDSVSVKLSTPWLVKWLQNPQSHSVEARMPNLGLTLAESQAITAYLLTQHGQVQLPQAGSPPSMSPSDMMRGKKLTESLGCLGCHTIRGEGSNVGPELTNVRSKVRPDWLYAWLMDPRKYLVNSRMPNFKLTKDQATLIGNYLMALSELGTARTGEEPDLADTSLSQTGAQLIAERGCAGCHDIKGFARMAAPDLSRVGEKTVDVLEFGDNKKVKHSVYDWLSNKVLDPASYNSASFKSRMPKFGLDASESEAIGVYLASLSASDLPPEYLKGIGRQDAPLEAGRRVFADHDCGACHRVSGVGGRIGPDLTREGEMVQPAWLFKFLKMPTRIRWWQDARMPDFNLSDADATTLTEYIMALANQETPYTYVPPEQMVYPLASAGAKYFTELKCQSCHPLAGKQLVAGGDTKKIGPDLGEAPRRLKSDWIYKFLKDPQGFSPGTQMPSYGKPDYEYKAIVDYLMKGSP